MQVMKIGEFSRRFALSPETVRYYINKGLLVPVSTNGRYLFTADDIDDMELLLRLKSYRFSIHEIHKILSLKRLSNLDSPEELKDYLDILRAQKSVLSKEVKGLLGTIHQLELEIATSSGKHGRAAGKKTGVPLSFLPYLACPRCGESMGIENSYIENQQILRGRLICACGYEAEIKEGIIVGEPGPISIYDGPDTERNCYRMMSPSLISLMQKGYHWLTKKLASCDTDGKLILEDFINNYCFCYSNLENLNPKALYILTDKYPEVVMTYKNLIDKMKLDYQILYIAAGSHLLPIKERTVDYYIDLDSSNEYAIFHDGYSADALTKYFHRDTCAAGSFFSFPPGSRSKKELKRQYPETWKYCLDASHFKYSLGRMWREMADYQNIGYVTDSGEGESFSYHMAGEKINLDVFFCRGYISGGYDHVT